MKTSTAEITLGEAWAAFLLAQGQRCRAATMEGLARARNRFCAAFGADTLLARLTTPRIERWLAERGRTVSPQTVLLDHGQFKWFFSWCVRRELVKENPLAKIDPPRVPEKPIRVVEPEEEEAVLAVIYPPCRPVIILAVETGLRWSTVSRLEWSMIDMEAGWLRIPGARMKSGRTLEVPLSPRALQTLAEIERRGDFVFEMRNQSKMSFRLALAREAAGVRHFCFHDLRKTFLTRQRQRGVPMEVAMALTDHKDLKTVLRCYRQIDKSELLHAVGR